jgi:hypothetical protein
MSFRRATALFTPTLPFALAWPALPWRVAMQLRLRHAGAAPASQPLPGLRGLPAEWNGFFAPHTGAFNLM